MKKIILCLFLFASLFSKGVAQSILVEYEEKQMNNLNHFDVWVTDSVTAMIGHSDEATLIVAPYLKHKRNGFTYCRETFMGNSNFYVKDSLHNFKWVLIPDTATILKRKCMSAKTTFRGREYKVFYAPSIPISDGPWKLGGLPGLILEAKSTDGFVEWRAIKLNLAYKGSYKIPDISKNTYLDWNTYVEKYHSSVEKLVHAMRSKGITQGAKAKLQVASKEIIHPQLNGEGVNIGD